MVNAAGIGLASGGRKREASARVCPTRAFAGPAPSAGPSTTRVSVGASGCARMGRLLGRAGEGKSARAAVFVFLFQKYK
jgi:hypothetical protein